MISANRQTNRTANVGGPLDPSRRHSRWPGIAPSRENANVMRDALVTHAIPQNSWPTVEIRITALAAALLKALSIIPSAGYALVSTIFVWVAAKVSASSTT